MMEIIPFAAAHLKGMDWNSLSEGLNMGVWPEAWRRRVIIQAAAGWAFSGFENGQWLGAAGLRPWWPGVAEAWLLLSPVGQKKSLAVVKALKKWLEVLIETLKIHRLQAPVRADLVSGRKLAEVLGFREEATMEKYGPDRSDYICYVRLPCLS
jgi:RimJ/RimL family protein N-acetyltransferase